jgi:hypothetical protein
MSQEEFYQTVMREQEFLESRLKDYMRLKEHLEWQLMEATNSIADVQKAIVNVQKQLGDISDEN